MQIGAAVTSGTVSSGAATALYTLPGGAAAGGYSIVATYNPGADYQGSSDTQSFTVSPAPTMAFVGGASPTFSTSDQMVGISAFVLTSAFPATGSVTFTITGGVLNLSTTAPLNNHSQTFGIFTLPGNTPAGSYAIAATY